MITLWALPAVALEPCGEPAEIGPVNATVVVHGEVPADDWDRAVLFWKNQGVTLVVSTETQADGPAFGGGATPAEALVPTQQLLDAVPGNGAIHVYVFDQLLVPDSPLASKFKELVGLTFTPSQVPLGLNPPSAPVILLDAGELGKHRAKTDFTVAHELGHALGFSHVSDPTNLMHRGRWFDCLPVLTPTQLQNLEDWPTRRRE